MTDELQAWRAGLGRGSRVTVTFNGWVMVGTIRWESDRLPDGERRWEIVWDTEDPRSGEWEDRWTTRYLQPVPEPKPAPPRRARTRSSRARIRSAG